MYRHDWPERKRPVADGVGDFGTGIGISGSQVGLNALTATLYPTQSRATGVSWSNAIGRCGMIVGSLSGGVMMAMNFSFDNLFSLLPFRRPSAR